jgi:hypothetical protein
VRLARRLEASDAASARWVGKDALRDLERPLVRARAAKAGKGAKARASRTAGKPAVGAKNAKAAKRSR